MAKFITTLRMEEIVEGTWQLSNALIYKSDLVQYAILAPGGFLTDLASVPRLPVVYWLLGGTAHKASVIHDWLYTSHEVERALADKILREAALSEGVSSFKANLLWIGVRLGGSSAWKSAEQRQRQYAYIRDLFKERKDEAE